MQRSEGHATPVSNNPIRGLLDLRSISTTPSERHCTRAGAEQASQGIFDDMTDLRSIRPFGREPSADISRPWLQLPE